MNILQLKKEIWSHRQPRVQWLFLITRGTCFHKQIYGCAGGCNVIGYSEFHSLLITHSRLSSLLHSHHFSINRCLCSWSISFCVIINHVTSRVTFLLIVERLIAHAWPCTDTYSCDNYCSLCLSISKMVPRLIFVHLKLSSPGLALRSVKSINVDFLNMIRYFSIK